MSRRLAIEMLENRLVLSGPQIDDAIWNLDAVGVDYIDFLQDDVGPVAPVIGQAAELHDDREISIAVPPLVNVGLFAADTDGSLRLNISGSRAAFAQLGARVATAANSPYLLFSGSLFNERASVEFNWQTLESWIADGVGDVAIGSFYLAEAPLYVADEAGIAAESEGGSIPVESIIANVASGNIPLVADGPQVVDWTAKRGPVDAAAPPARVAIAGELARAVAFETIDGEAAPMVYAESGSTVYGELTVASIGSPMLIPAELQGQLAAEHRDPGGRVVESAYPPVASSHGGKSLVLPASVEQLLAALPWASVPGALPSDALADSRRYDEAFSQFGESDVDDERLDEERRPHAWLTAMPVLAVLAAERIVAAKRNREREAAHLPG